MTKIFLIANFASTFCLCGVIWIIQLVHYPSFSQVSSENFQKFHQAHSFWITPVVAPLMITELVAAFLILFYPPANIDYKLLIFAFVLTLTTWASTAFIQVPLHNKLARGFSADACAALVDTNWIRTIAWSLRGILLLYFISKTIK